MTTPTAQRAEWIFIAAQELDPAERDAFIKQACAGEKSLIKEVEALLAAATGAEGFFSKLSQRLGVAALFDDAADEGASHGSRVGGELGLSVGPYKLTQPIGSGGMGTVWRAERSDGLYEGEVAVKLLNLAAGGPAARRFELEGRYLAKLTHPNIARLLDAGVLASGQPYLVLECVEGLAIDRYCDERELGIEQRVRLFLGALEAVAHAHSNLIIHRDIKPSNVFVTGDGMVKLLDFGVAKLLRPEEPADAVTREFGTALTPEFAAPEQLLGGAITTATDVYSLGLLLYLLLAGRHPRSGAKTDSFAALQAALQEEPRNLSDVVTDQGAVSSEELSTNARHRAATPATLRRALRGDLDNIVRKALAVDPAQRYGTVVDFAADLRRFLRHEPVSAQPDTVRYRVGKFVRRHRGGVLAASLTTLTLISAVILTAWQMVEARRQRDVALYQQQRVQATNEFLQLLLGELGPSGEPLTLVELLGRGVKLLDRQYGAEERFVARTLYEVSILYATLGRTDAQLELLERAAKIAQEAGDDDLLGTLLCAKARFELVSAPAAAETDAAQGKKLLAGVTHPFEDGIVECWRAEAMLHHTHGDREAAIEAYKEALRVVETRPAPSSANRLLLLNDLAEQYFNADRPADALPMLDEIIDLHDRIGRGGTVGHVIYLMNRAAVLSRLGEVSSAAQSQRESLERVKGLEDPPVGMAGHYGNSVLRLARNDEALTLFQADHAAAVASGNLRWIALTEVQIGRTLVRLGRRSEAEDYLNRAEAVLLETPGAHQRFLVMIALARAEALLDGGDAAGATQAVNTVLEDLDYPNSTDAIGLSSALWAAARAAIVTGNAAAAEQYATDGLGIVAAIARDPRRSADVGQALLQRGKARLALGRTSAAVEDLRAAVESLTNGFGADHPETREALQLLDAAVPRS